MSNELVEQQPFTGIEERDKILAFERTLSAHPGAKFGDSDLCPLKHSFADGVYVREIFIPKGVALTGKIHKHSHPNFLLKGKVQVYTEFEGVQTLEAPLSMISKAGTKRVVVALEDTVWVTIHATEETDLEKIEDHVIAKSYAAFAAFSKLKEIEIKKEPVMDNVIKKNCLILALLELGRPVDCLIGLNAPGEYLIPFKKSVNALTAAGISLDGILFIKGEDGVFHANTSSGEPVENLDISDSDFVGTWGFVAAGVVAAGTSAYSGHQSRKAAKSAQGRLDGLEYIEDPDYTDTQAKLKELGMGILDGNIPDYYKSIGETGGSEFEGALGLVNRDISRSAQEAAAASGRGRGGNLPAVTAQSIADTALKARYQDYERSLTGKQNLLTTGISTLEGVRTAAFGEQTDRNELEAAKTGAMINLDFYKADAKSQEVAGYGSALTSIIGGVGGGGGSGSGLLGLLGGNKTANTTTAKQQASGLGALGNIDLYNEYKLSGYYS